jgi:hypothetical protein
MLGMSSLFTGALPIGCFLCDEQSHYNTFTGFLLYATD